MLQPHAPEQFNEEPTDKKEVAGQLNELPTNDQINEKIIKNTIDHVGTGKATEAGGMGRLKKT